MNLTGLYNYIYKKPGKAKILASIVVEIGKDENGNPVKAKIDFARDRNRSRKWLAVLSTDITLSDVKQPGYRLYKSGKATVFGKTIVKLCINRLQFYV